MTTAAGMEVIEAERRRSRRRRWARRTVVWLSRAALVVLALMAWDLARAR